MASLIKIYNAKIVLNNFISLLVFNKTNQTEIKILKKCVSFKTMWTIIHTLTPLVHLCDFLESFPPSEPNAPNIASLYVALWLTHSIHHFIDFMLIVFFIVRANAITTVVVVANFDVW